MPSTTGIILSDPVTFANYGPATTTFTQAPSCTESSRYLIGFEKSNSIVTRWRVQCSTSGYSGCLPPTTTPTTTAEEHFAATVGYHSPGLHCPAGWATFGLASRDKEGSINYSGSAIPTTTLKKNSPNPFDFDFKAYLLARALDSGETMVVCCPSSMTADGKGGCQSRVPDYTPTFGCNPDFLWNFTRTSTEFTTIDGTPSKQITNNTFLSTIFTASTTSFSSSGDEATFSAIEYFPMVTLVHRQSDIDAAATSTSNAALRMMPPSNPVSGFGLGTPAIVLAALLTLGAAIVL